MTSDKELLEMAAKAAGIDGRYASLDEFPDWMTCHDGEGIYFTGSQAWNPLTDDGDALRLAVKLGMLIDDIERGFMAGHILATAGEGMAAYEPRYFDPYAATRRAIVRAAASIGESMV